MTSRMLPAALLTLTLALTACAGGADDDSGKGADRAGMTAGTIREGGPAPPRQVHPAGEDRRRR